jgi:ribosomal-protein-alanine N-acetyltransferase
MNTSVRTLGPEGAALLAALHAACFPQPWSETAMAALLAASGVTGLVLDRGGDPAGLALVRAVAGEAEVLTLGVTPEARRQGAGRALLSACIEAARRARCETLFLEVADTNAAAAALYARAGFVETGRRARYYSDGGDARLLALAL